MLFAWRLIAHEVDLSDVGCPVVGYPEVDLSKVGCPEVDCLEVDLSEVG